MDNRRFTRRSVTDRTPVPALCQSARHLMIPSQRAYASPMVTELCAPDDTTRRFTPIGLSTAGLLSPEASLAYLRSLISIAELHDSLPPLVRRRFDAVRNLFLHGLFKHDFFALVDQLGLLLLEAVLGERFVLYYDGRFTLLDGGLERPIKVSRFAELATLLLGDGYARASKRPVIASMPKFRPNLQSLLRWARAEGLLRGQRNRNVEYALNHLRNYAAHPHHGIGAFPPDAAMTLCDVAEIANHLWGFDTEGGRLYPRPIERAPMLLARQVDGSAATVGRAEDIETLPTEWEDAMFMILMAFPGDELWGYSPDVENTRYPTRHIAGPITRQEATRFVRAAAGSWGSDRVDYLDRLFFVRTEAGAPGPARNLQQVWRLASQDRTGGWRLLQADYPGSAVWHVSKRSGASEPCVVENDFCRSCAVSEISDGPLGRLIGIAEVLQPRGG